MQDLCQLIAFACPVTAYHGPVLAVCTQPSQPQSGTTDILKAQHTGTAPLWDTLWPGTILGTSLLGRFKVGTILAYIKLWHACRLQVPCQAQGIFLCKNRARWPAVSKRGVAFFMQTTGRCRLAHQLACLLHKKELCQAVLARLLHKKDFICKI